MTEPIPPGPLDPGSSRALLDNIMKYAGYLRGNLAEEALTPDEATAFKEVMSIFDTEGIKLPPYLVPRPITEAADLAVFLSDGEMDAPRLLERFAFYLVVVHLTILPRRGLGPPELEIRLAFNPGEPEENAPLSFALFPKRRWQDLGHVQGKGVTDE